ncbi:hypothetical protein DERP_009160 [Dermatophagoides pteronyssinus]|uniref:MADF domain-containing protein n=2 Tax=Dermatophagoides pteronyssinus TaxID=6956 RepID=A0ABQ8JQX3_DERPT|nr:hypothetical protein DERP_009160 [Dermatophagoides pteronyssinus]
MTNMADNKVDPFKLIELVKQRPVLYDELLPEYQQYRQRQRAWNEVSRILKQPVDKCQYKWRSIRSLYNGYLRRKTKNPSQQISCQYSDHLQFLDDYLRRKRKSKSKERELDEGEEEDEDDDDQMDDEEKDDDDEEAEELDEEDDLDKEKTSSKENFVGRLLQEMYAKQQERLRNFTRRSSPFVSHTPTTQATTRMSRTPSISRYDQFSNEEDDDDDGEQFLPKQKLALHSTTCVLEDLQVWGIFVVVLVALAALVILWPTYLGRILRFRS